VFALSFGDSPLLDFLDGGLLATKFSINCSPSFFGFSEFNPLSYSWDPEEGIGLADPLRFYVPEF